MTFLDEYWNQESNLRHAFMSTLKSHPDSDALKVWVSHLSLFFTECSPDSLNDYASFDEAVFHLILEQLGIVDSVNSNMVDANELHAIFMMFPKFRQYCDDLVAANGAWAVLKYKSPLQKGDGFNRVLEALIIA